MPQPLFNTPASHPSDFAPHQQQRQQQQHPSNTGKASPNVNPNPADGEGPSTSGRSFGWGLGRSADVVQCRADWMYQKGHYQAAYNLATDALKRDPYALQLLPVQLASCLQLGKKNELFLLGHRCGTPRLFGLVRNRGAEAIIVLSGHRHGTRDCCYGFCSIAVQSSSKCSTTHVLSLSREALTKP